MLKTIFKIGLLIVVALVGYNYFLGNEDEKAQSREIVGKAGELGKEAWNLLVSEREKMKEGKYDGALDKLEGLYTSLKSQAEDLRDSDALRKIKDLNERREELESMLTNSENELSGEAKRKLNDLTAETEELMNEMEAKGRPAPPQ